MTSKAPDVQTYVKEVPAEVAFASQEQYIALHVLKKDVVDEFRGALSTSSIGKGCIRFSKPDQMDFGTIERLLRRTAESSSTPR
ncbi:MAG: DUF1801 domain-containing protein [Acidobacteriota bacterium]|nr:DUF1801 domain-containing protein [Acidobacteriota bacterium]